MEKKPILAALVEETGSLNLKTEKIIGSAFKVANSLGNGFLEKVYENSVAYELRKLGFVVEQQKDVPVFYEGIKVGRYEPDIVVDNAVIIEFKSVRALTDVHKAQCLNYLKATGFKVCLLLNFGNPKIEVKRVSL